MNRRRFLSLLGLAPLAPLAAKAAGAQYAHPLYFGRMPRYNIGGIAGEEVPIIARMGDGVITITANTSGLKSTQDEVARMVRRSCREAMSKAVAERKRS